MSTESPPPLEPHPITVRLRRAARMLDVSERTLWGLARSGEIKSFSSRTASGSFASRTWRHGRQLALALLKNRVDTFGMATYQFADQVRRAMLAALEARGMTRYRLAKVLGCNESTLSNFVNGRTWIGETLVNAIAKELRLRVTSDPTPKPAKKRSDR